MNWVLIWFLLLPSGPVQILDVPEKHFTSEKECFDFAVDRVELVRLFKGGDDEVAFKCAKADDL